LLVFLLLNKGKKNNLVLLTGYPRRTHLIALFLCFNKNLTLIRRFGGKQADFE
jgi:uridine phosphorylase